MLESIFISVHTWALCAILLSRLEKMAKVKKEADYYQSTEGTGHFYTVRRTTKKIKEAPAELKKFDPVAGKHVIYKQVKSPKKIDKKYREGRRQIQEATVA